MHARNTHHHRCRRRHHRPVAGADAGAPRPSRAADRALGRAVRAVRPAPMRAPCSRPTARRRRPRPSCATSASRSHRRCGARLFRAPSLKARWWLPARATAARSTRFARLTEGHDTPRRRGHRRAGARSGRALRRRPVLCRRRRTWRRWRRCASCSRRRRRAGVEVVFGTELARRARRQTRSSSTAAASARAASLPTCAACAASAWSCAAREVGLQPAGAAPASAPPALRRAVGRRPAHGRRHRDRERRRRPGHRALGARAAGQGLRAASGLRRGRDRRDGRRRAPGLRRQRAEDRRARPHHPRQRPLPPRLPAGARRWPSLVADYLETGAIDNRVFVVDGACSRLRARCVMAAWRRRSWPAMSRNSQLPARRSIAIAAGSDVARSGAPCTCGIAVASAASPSRPCDVGNLDPRTSVADPGRPSWLRALSQMMQRVAATRQQPRAGSTWRFRASRTAAARAHRVNSMPATSCAPSLHARSRAA